MSKKRRIRKHRSQWDRIELRRSKCEMMARITGYCKHGPRFEYGTFDAEASSILAKNAPSMEELESISCARIWDVIRHPMTQLYAMIDPQWFECHILRKLHLDKGNDGQSSPSTRRSKLDAEKLLRKVALRRRSRRAVQKAYFKAYVGQPFFRVRSWIHCSSGRRLLLAKRYRAIARKKKVASLNGKYGRPRVSRTAVPSR